MFEDNIKTKKIDIEIVVLLAECLAITIYELLIYDITFISFGMR
jgi:hypothetical protein